MTTTITVPAYVNSMGYKDWWCPCGITPSDVVAAYAAKGAANLASSYINLANPGVYDLDDNGDSTPDWNSTDGWIFNRFAHIYTTSSITYNQNTSLVVKFNNCTGGYFRSYCLASLDYETGVNYYIAPSDAEGWMMVFCNGIFGQYNSEILSGVISLAKGNLYLDGNYLNSIETPNYSNSHELIIGANGDVGVSIFETYAGNIQAVSLYNKVLTQEQIQSIGSSMP